MAAWLSGLGAAVISLSACTHRVDVQPIRVEPIYLTVDVNVRLDRELEESFGFEERIEHQLETAVPATTAPAAAPATVPAATAPSTAPANAPAGSGGTQ